MSGGFSVPFTALAVIADNKYAQLIFGCLAFSGAWFAAYRVWKIEREKVIELEGKLVPTKTEPFPNWSIHEIFSHIRPDFLTSTTLADFERQGIPESVFR